MCVSGPWGGQVHVVNFVNLAKRTSRSLFKVEGERLIDPYRNQGSYMFSFPQTRIAGPPREKQKKKVVGSGVGLCKWLIWWPSTQKNIDKSIGTENKKKNVVRIL